MLNQKTSIRWDANLVPLKACIPLHFQSSSSEINLATLDNVTLLESALDTLIYELGLRRAQEFHLEV